LSEEQFTFRETRLDQDLIHGPNAGHGYTSHTSDMGLSLEDLLLRVGHQLSARHRDTVVESLSSEKNGTPTSVIRLQAFAVSHPELRNAIMRGLDGIAATPSAVLHGDLSAEDILLGAEHGEFADKEWKDRGDPAIDLAHLMADLFVLATHRQSCLLLTAVGSLHLGYFRELPDEPRVPLAFRAGPLTAAYMLEISQRATYLAEPMREDLLMFATWWLKRQHYTLGQVRDALWTALDMGFVNGPIDWRQDYAAVQLGPEH
jgi:hypothetical protein